MSIETVTTLNFTTLFIPIFKFILLLLAIFGGYSLIKDLIVNISRGFNDKLNNETIQKLSSKDIKLVTIENAQEIHEINKSIDEINKRIKKIEGVSINEHNSN